MSSDKEQRGTKSNQIIMVGGSDGKRTKEASNELRPQPDNN